MGKGVRLRVSTGILNPCPKCGRTPKLYRDFGYEESGFGAWCTIECKPLFKRPHFTVEQGNAQWGRAVGRAVAIWNGWADGERRDND